MDNVSMDNEGIFLRKMIKIVGEADTIIVNCPLSIVNYYRSNGTINWNLMLFLDELNIFYCVQIGIMVEYIK